MVRSIVPWYGAKNKMCKSINYFIPETKVYVEVFGGAMNVLINRVPTGKEVYNDLNKGLVAIFNCIKHEHKAKKIQSLLREIPYSKEVFNYALERYNNCNVENEMELAILKYILITQSFNSTCKSWRKSKTPDIIATYTNRIINILDFTPRLKDVIIENKDYEDIFIKYDSKDTFFYLDPPYVLSTRGKHSGKDYRHDVKDDMHENLVKIIRECKGKVLLSGYDNDIYENGLVRYGWDKIKLGDYPLLSKNNSKGYKDRKSEYIWKNY